MREFLTKMKSGTVELNYGRETIVKLTNRHFSNNEAETLRLMDLGLGLGEDVRHLINGLAPKQIEAFGLEFHKPYIREAEQKGIKVFQVDLERDSFPFDNSTFDIVLANQVLEHTKEIFWITSEAARVLRPGGLFLVGVPNLASLHSRIMLLLGMQPGDTETTACQLCWIGDFDDVAPSSSVTR